MHKHSIAVLQALCVMAAFTAAAAVSSQQLVTRDGGPLCDGDIPVLPGADGMGVGFDIRTGSAEGKQRVVELSFDGGPVYVNPFDPDLKYCVPKELFVKDNTGNENVVKSEVFYKSNDYAEYLTREASGSIEGPLGFTLSAKVESAKSRLEQSAQYGSIVESNLEVTLYDVIADPPLELPVTTGFKNAVEQLPVEYSPATKADFEGFVQLFGTHYISSAVFGGAGVMSTAVNAEYSSRQTSGTISAQANLHFGWLKAGGSGSEQRDESDEDFREGSEILTVMTGGDPTKIEDWDEWTKTFYQAPAMVRHQVQPIASLIANIDPSKAREFGLAVNDLVAGSQTLCAREDSIIERLIQIQSMSSDNYFATSPPELKTERGVLVTAQPSVLTGFSVQAGNHMVAKKCYIKFYDTASEPLRDDKPVLRTRITAYITSTSSTFSTSETRFPISTSGVRFKHGIAIRVTNGIADSSAEDCNEELYATIMYK